MVLSSFRSWIDSESFTPNYLMGPLEVEILFGIIFDCLGKYDFGIIITY